MYKWVEREVEERRELVVLQEGRLQKLIRNLKNKIKQDVKNFEITITNLTKNNK